jgi:hypothetical protein
MGLALARAGQADAAWAVYECHGGAGRVGGPTLAAVIVVLCQGRGAASTPALVRFTNAVRRLARHRRWMRDG